MLHVRLMVSPLNAAMVWGDITLFGCAETFNETVPTTVVPNTQTKVPGIKQR